jgi:phage gp37-like protein
MRAARVYRRLDVRLRRPHEMIGELEDAIVARLKELRLALPYRLPTVESYGGQIIEEKQSTFKFPAVFVAFTGSQHTKSLGEKDRIMTVSLILYVATRNPRNERATRQGDANEVGSYQLAEDVIAALENQRVGMPMYQPLRHTKIETLFVAHKSDGAKAESILAVYFECEFAWRAALPECAHLTNDDWLKTGQAFYIKPGDDVADLNAATTHAEP